VKRGSGTGVCLHEKGYLQITRRGPWRNWLVHRKVMLEALQQSLYWKHHPSVLRNKIPNEMTVEHLDHRRRHNCIENLMLLDKRIHDFISNDQWMRMVGDRRHKEQEEQKKQEEQETPDWVMAEEPETVITVPEEEAVVE
jgi:hypothetical protein